MASFFTPRGGGGKEESLDCGGGASAQASTELPAGGAAGSSIESRELGSGHLASGVALDPEWGSPVLAALTDLLRTTGLHIELLHKILHDTGGSQAPRVWPPSEPGVARSSTAHASAEPGGHPT